LILLLMGHRGAGKSHVLKELQALGFPAAFFDLDQEIEKRKGSIAEIFENLGESQFRQIEQEILNDVVGNLKNENAVIALGAGFEGVTPKDAVKIWIRRESDVSGRIFLNRPSLEKDLSPLNEWEKRFHSREEKFKAEHDDVLTLPEGRWLVRKVLLEFFKTWMPMANLESSPKRPYFATVLPEDESRFLKKTLYRDSKRLEIREDLLSEGLRNGIQNLPSDRIYFSHRNQKSTASKTFEFEDWDLELGAPERSFATYSYHGKDVQKFEAVQSQSGLLKWAPFVEDFSRLQAGHRWWQMDPQKRSFLPRSTTGRWRWYRRLFGMQMPVNFLKDIQGSAKDQSYWYESFLQPLDSNGFAAVLGDSVDLSWSPSFHEEFFSKHQMPFVSLSLKKEEFFDALLFLKDLGLKCAAVTTPFKEMAAEVVTEWIDDSQKLNAVNTLYFRGRKVFGANTDQVGLSKLAVTKDSSVVVWGGGGLKSALQKVFPKAQFVAARQGAVLKEPSTVIWASRRSEDVKWPSPLECVKKVIDMNYFENSMGLELAKLAGCDYQSGELLFVAQALGQQKIWSSFL